jgi:hypothetical protein
MGPTRTLSPSVGPFMHRRVSQRALYWRRVIHLRTLKASGISSWYSCQTDRLQTIGSKRRNSVFGVLGPVRTCESNLKPRAMCSWSRQLNSNFSCQRQLHRLFPRASVTTMDKLHFDRTDYSVVVKNRAPPPSSWKWEIYRAGRSSPIKQSSVYFHTMVTANRAGKEALKQLLDKLPVSQADIRADHARLPRERFM